MWDEDDILGRLVQGLFGLAIIVIAIPCIHVAIGNDGVKSWSDFAAITFLCLSVPLSARCIWYAVTGRNGFDRHGF